MGSVVAPYFRLSRDLWRIFYIPLRLLNYIEPQFFVSGLSPSKHFSSYQRWCNAVLPTEKRWPAVGMQHWPKAKCTKIPSLATVGLLLLASVGLLLLASIGVPVLVCNCCLPASRSICYYLPTSAYYCFSASATHCQHYFNKRSKSQF